MPMHVCPDAFSRKRWLRRFSIGSTGEEDSPADSMTDHQASNVGLKLRNPFRSLSRGHSRQVALIASDDRRRFDQAIFGTQDKHWMPIRQCLAQTTPKQGARRVEVPSWMLARPLSLGARNDRRGHHTLRVPSAPCRVSTGPTNAVLDAHSPASTHDHSGHRLSTP